MKKAWNISRMPTQMRMARAAIVEFEASALESEKEGLKHETTDS